MDDFTFPTIAAAEPDLASHHLPFPHFATSPLWFPSTAALAATAEAPKTRLVMRPEAEEDGHGPFAAADEEKMDLLWENFNEELQRAASRAAGVGSELSDTESEAGRQHGCAPMLRASSRAGAASRCRKTSWMLLLRIFRRLFVIEKSISAARRTAQ